MKTACPNCGQHFAIEQEHIGSTAQCTSCGKDFIIQVLPEEPVSTDSQPAVQNEYAQGPVPQSASVSVDQSASRMKTLTCEMCGSTNLMKQDGVFVCQSCGTRYSVEEAKKMMIAGTVNVAGTVTVDNSSFVKKYLLNARRALAKTDWDEVEKYYNMVEQNDPQNIEAIFYSSFGKAMLSLSDADPYKRLQKFEVFCKSESVIDDYYDPAHSGDLKTVIQGMSEHLLQMFEFKFVYQPNDLTPLRNFGLPEYISLPLAKWDGDAQLTYGIFSMTEIQFIESIENIIKKDEQYYLLKILLTHYDRCLINKRLTSDIKSKICSKREKTVKRLTELDPDFHPSPAPSIGGCYIATAVYGSYDCPQVWILRRYRDNDLASTIFGRTFIHTYYAISPTLVRWFGESEWFKTFWKRHLDRMIFKLKLRGIADTPYKDRTWK